MCHCHCHCLQHGTCDPHACGMGGPLQSATFTVAATAKSAATASASSCSSARFPRWFRQSDCQGPRPEFSLQVSVYGQSDRVCVASDRFFLCGVWRVRGVRVCVSVCLCATGLVCVACGVSVWSARFAWCLTRNHKRKSWHDSPFAC